MTRTPGGRGPVPEVKEKKSLVLEGPEFEIELRDWEVPGRKHLAVPIILLGGVLVLLLGAAGFTDLAPELAPRAAAVQFGLALFSFLAAWRVWAARQPRMLDAWIFAWTLLVSVALAARHVSAVTMPPMHHTLDVILTILWLLLPNAIRLQMIPALVISGSAMVTDWGEADPTTLLAAYGFALIGGTAAAWERVRTTRARFRAVKEIRTLRGLLPMCAACKKIRDDDGEWIPVEVYVRDHTYAEFTHGMCPDCLKEYYGEHAVVES